MSSTPFETKRKRIHKYLVDQGYEALILGQYRNFAWLTEGGSNLVDTTADRGVALLKVGAKDAQLIASTIEAPRMETEVLGDLPLELVTVPWHDTSALVAAIRAGRRPRRLAGDVSIPGAGISQPPRGLWTLRAPLLDGELDRYRALGRDAAHAVETVARELEPGCTEHQVAGAVAGRLYALGIRPLVLLVGGDDRLERFRHPVPTAARVERACMIVVCAERHGLSANLTRLVHFGAVSDATHAAHAAVVQVEAALLGASTPGATLGDVFRAGMEAYAAAGHPDEWQRHHQGGTTGFATRDVVATPESTEALVAGQAVTWNPSLPGVKSEDTFLVTDDGLELLTPAGEGWPTVDAAVGGRSVPRPAILER